MAKFGRDTFAFVGSERGNFVAVYRLDRDGPEYVQLLPITNGPEGLLAIPKRRLFVTASEVDDAGEGFDFSDRADGGGEASIGDSDSGRQHLLRDIQG